MPKQKQKVVLPGISFIPDPIMCFEKESLQRKLAWEFLDFLDCVTDLLTLLDAIKVKHLRTMKPIPFEVIREVRMEAEKGINVRTYMRKFEKNISVTSVGISPSTDRLLGQTKSAAGSNWMRNAMNMTKKIKGGAGIETDLLLTKLGGGKPTKPMWHVLAKEKHITVAMVMADEKKKEQNKMKKMMAGTSKTSNKKGDRASIQSATDSSTEFRRIKKDPFSIKFATGSVPRAPSKAQQALMDAYAQGFTSVESHQKFVETLEPYWYTDLIKHSISTGIHQTKEIVAGFERLGKHFETNCTSIPQSRAKICLIFHSLPIWDATRLHMQRAAEYILKDILLVPNPGRQIKEWIQGRRLPYVVIPPIMGDKDDSGDEDIGGDAGSENSMDDN